MPPRLTEKLDLQVYNEKETVKSPICFEFLWGVQARSSRRLGALDTTFTGVMPWSPGTKDELVV